MCGIHGYINGSTREINADNYIRQAFTANMLRGMDSSGIACIDADTGASSYQKLPVSGTYFVQDKVAAEMIRKASNKRHITFCHTRHATQGVINMPNAHPFQATDVDDDNVFNREIVGVHNGTLNGWKNKKDGGKYDVDSEWAINHIFQRGTEAFKDFAGAYAFVWWDSDDWKTLNIARNAERSLFVAFTKDGGMAFASEAGMLVWLMERNKIEIEGEVRELTPGFLYKFDVTKVKEFTKEELPKFAFPAHNVSPVGSPTYNAGRYSPSYTHKSISDKVSDLLDKIKGRGKPEPIALLPSPAATVDGEKLAEGIKKEINTFLKREEIDNASIMGVQGARGTFIPRYEDHNDKKLYGAVQVGNMEFDAVMRNVSGLAWKAEEMYDVSILGMIDDGQEMCCVVSKPRFTLVSKTEDKQVEMNY